MRSFEIFRDIFIEKQGRNTKYSLRALARDLEVSPTFLSLFLNGKKKLSFQRALAFAQMLGLDEKTSQAFLKSVAIELAKDKDYQVFLKTSVEHAQIDIEREQFHVLELDRFKTLSEWYHIAILDFTEVKNFKSDEKWVAKQLGITKDQVLAAVARLERLGLLETRARQWRKTQSKLAIPTNHSEKAVREFHSQMMIRAKEAMARAEPHEFEEREVCGSTMAINSSRIPEARKRIQKFRRELLEYLTEGECDELYQLNLQFFRLTKERMTKRVSKKGTKK